MCARPWRPSMARSASCSARTCSSGAETRRAMTRRLTWLIVAVGTVAPSLVWLGASAQTPAAPAWVSDPQGDAAAKKEGAVVHYCTLPQAYCEDIGKRFEKQTGIKADITRTPSGAQYSRLMQEH